MPTTPKITMGVTEYDLRDADAQEKLTQLKSDFSEYIIDVQTTTPTYTLLSKAINVNGGTGAVTVSDSTTVSMTDYIPVIPGDVIRYYRTGLSLGNCAFFDSEKNGITGSSFSSPTATEQSVIVPTGAAYVSFSGITARLSGLVVNIDHTVKGDVYDEIDKN